MEQREHGEQILFDELMRPVLPKSLQAKAAALAWDNMQKYAKRINSEAATLLFTEYVAICHGLPFFLLAGEQAANIYEQMHDYGKRDEILFILLRKIEAVAEFPKVPTGGNALINGAAVCAAVMLTGQTIEGTQEEHKKAKEAFFRMTPQIKYAFSYAIAKNALNATREELDTIAGEYLAILALTTDKAKEREELDTIADELKGLFTNSTTPPKAARKKTAERVREQNADEKLLRFSVNALNIASSPMRYNVKKQPNFIPSTGKFVGSMETFLEENRGRGGIPAEVTAANMETAWQGVSNMFANGLFSTDKGTGFRTAEISLTKFVEYAIDRHPNEKEFKAVYNGLLALDAIRIATGFSSKDDNSKVVTIEQQTSGKVILGVPPIIYKSNVVIMTAEEWRKIQALGNYHRKASFVRFRSQILRTCHKDRERLLCDIFGYDDKIEAARDKGEEAYKKAVRRIQKDKAKDRNTLKAYFDAAKREGIIIDYKEKDGVYKWRRFISAADSQLLTK